MDRHLKRLDNHSQYSVDQIGSDCTRIDLRTSVFLKFCGGRGMPPNPPSHFGLCPHICASRKTLSSPAPPDQKHLPTLLINRLTISSNFKELAQTIVCYSIIDDNSLQTHVAHSETTHHQTSAVRLNLAKRREGVCSKGMMQKLCGFLPSPYLIKTAGGFMTCINFAT